MADMPRRRPGDKARRVMAVLLVTTFVVVWSSGYLAGAIGTRTAAPLALVAWRFLAALAIMATVSLASGARWPSGTRGYLHLMITGALLQTGQLGCIYLALASGVPAGLTSLVLSTNPMVVAAVAVPLFAERLTGRQWSGLAIGLCGVVISLAGRAATGGGPQGYAFTMLALTAFAAGTLYQKRFGGTVDLRTGVTVQLLGATLTAFPLAALRGGLGIPLTAPVLGSLLWAATICSIGSFALLFVLLRRHPVGAATSPLYLVPPVTAVTAVPMLGQHVSGSVLLGMLVCGGGVLLTGAIRLGRARPGPGSTSGRRPTPDPAAVPCRADA